MKEEILNYIEHNKYIEVPILQDKFNLSYKEARNIIDELIANNTLAFDSGVKYSYVGKSTSSSDNIENRVEIQNTDSEEERLAIRRKYLEERRQELLKRLQAETKDDEENDGIDFLSDSDEELRLKALQFCVEKERASATLLQHVFSIGFARACKLLFWMEKMGYISKGDNFHPRKILISQEELDELLVKKHMKENDESDNYNEDDIEQNDNVVDLRPILVKCFEQGLQVKSDTENYILGLNEELAIELKFVKDGSALVLSDGGKTISKTKKRSLVVKKILKNFAPVELKSKEICITVESPRGVLMALLILYSAIDAVMKMD